MTAALLATTLVGASLASTGTAEARYGRNGAFAAGAVLGLVGGSLLNSGYYGEDDYAPVYRPVHYRRSYGHCFYQKKWVSGYAGWTKVLVKVCN